MKRGGVKGGREKESERVEGEREDTADKAIAFSLHDTRSTRKTMLGISLIL